MGKIRQKRLVVLVGILLMISVGSTLAYFWATDTAINNFTMGSVDIKVVEKNWNPDEAKNITPNETIAKDPKLENKGNNEAYLFMSVDIPKENVAVADDKGKLRASAMTDLFFYTVNEGWKLIETVNHHKSNEYIYAYMTDGLTPVGVDQETNTLFDEVRFANLVEPLSSSNMDIVIKGYGIQTAGLDRSNSKEVWETIVNHSK